MKMNLLQCLRFAWLGGLAGAVLGASILFAQDITARSDTAAPLVAGTAPFRPLTPTRLPTGTTLQAIDARTHANGLTGDVDTFYALPNGTRLHIWQTNRTPDQLRPKNPLDEPGAVHQGSRTAWVALPGFGGRVLTLNGVIHGRVVSLDANLAVAQLLEIAESLR